MNRPFENIVTEHGATVLRVCRAVVGPVHADDAWSDTFLAALTAFPALPNDANVEAWLVTIAHRKAIDILRTRARQPVPVAEPPERATPDDAVGWRHELRDALRALPRRQRQAIAYHYLAGLPYADVAGVLGGSEAAARKAASDGVKTLRATYLEGDRR